MDCLIKGIWHEGSPARCARSSCHMTSWYDTGKTAGEFVRAESQFRDFVTADGARGFKAEPALIRFDAVYYTHFKCNLKRIEDYPNLSNYLRDLYQVPGVAETVNLDHIKRHYFLSHRHLNPSGLVPKGPLLDFRRPHDRDRLATRATRRAS